jgi:hypothetical protein
MYEEDPEADAMADLAVKGDIDFAQLSDPTKVPGLLQSLYKQQMGALTQQEAGAKTRFEAGEARIRERNQGPSRSDQLFMLSKALLAPRDYRGFAGTVGKISGAFGDISAAEKKAGEARNAQLAALQDAYATQADGYGVTRAKTAADFLGKAGPLLKKPTRSTASPVTVGPDLKVRARATGVELKEPPLDAIYTLQTYLENPANTPENKMIARKNFDKNFGYGSSDIYGERQ